MRIDGRALDELRSVKFTPDFTKFAEGSCLVEMGDTVKAGQPLISFDRDAIKAAGHEDIVTVIISELDRLKSIDHVGESGTLIGGNPLVKLGDPLLVAKTK